MAQLSDLITITRLPQPADMQADLAAGRFFQYQKSGGDNYVFNNHQPMHYSAYLTYPAGVVRGNHYHQYKEENLLVLTGEIKIKCWLLEQPDDVAEYILAPGQLVNLRPGVAHACVSERGATAIEFCPQPLDVSDSYNTTLLGILGDKDFGFTESPEKVAHNHSRRYCVRCLLTNDQGELCVSKSEKHGFYQLPGGGIDTGESIIDGLRREVREEAGYEIDDIRSLGYFLENKYSERNLWATQWISFVFTARAGHNTGTQLEDYEEAEGYHPVWLSPREAYEAQLAACQHLNLDGFDDNTVYHGHFANHRDLLLLQKYYSLS